MPEQQYCRFELDDCRRHAQKGLAIDGTGAEQSANHRLHGSALRQLRDLRTAGDPATIILWLLPACFVVGGALVIFRLSRRSRAERISELSAQEQERLKALLDDNKRTLK